MADLGLADAVWLRFFREESYFLRMSRRLEEMRRYVTRERQQFVVEGDVAPSVTSGQFETDTAAAELVNQLEGVEAGTNTDEAGFIYLRISGGNQIDAYKATGGGGGDLVAQATSVSASATATFTAQNSSGLTLVLRTGSGFANDTTDQLRLRAIPDAKLELLKLWPSDGTTTEDAASRQAAQTMLDGLATNFETALEIVREGMRQWALSSAANPVARGNKFLLVNEATLLSEQVNQDSSGTITRLRSGFFEEQRSSMRDNTTGSTQDILQRVVAAAAGVFDSNNTGAGAVASHTPEGHTPIGSWRFACVSGLGNGGGGSERFDMSFQSSTDDATLSGRDLTIKQSWKGPEGFGGITLTRVPTKTGDGSNLHAGASTTFTFDGESEDNSSSGILYITVAANAANWDFSFYSSSLRGSGDLVAKVENVATSAASVQATGRNGSGLTVTFDVGSAPVDTTEFSVDMKFFSVQNTVDVPDKFSIATSLTSEGKASRVLAQIWDAYMHADGSPLIDDDLLAGFNTFPQRAATDI